MRKLFVFCAVALAVIAVRPPLLAVSTRSFEFGEFKQWESAELKGVKVSSTGEVSLGLDTRAVPAGEKEIWSSVVARDGRVYFTTGNGAALYRIDGDAKAPKVAQVFRADEVAFSCIAQGPDGRLYVGSLPAGRIYAIDAKGEGKVFTTVPAPYVWSLAFDREGHLLASTGPEGVIYRISPNGEAKIHYDARDGNVLSLALSPTGELYAGSAGKGLVYRIRKAGEAEVVWDFHGREVKALTFHGDKLFAAVNDGQARSATPGGREAGRTALEFSNLARKLSTKFEGAEVSQEGAEIASEGSLLKRYDAAGAATIEEISPEGRVETIWELPDSAILDLKADADGTLLAATAKSGRVYSIVPRGASHLLLTAEEAQAVTLALAGGRLAFVGHSNPGSAVSVAATPPATGQLLTRPLDSGFPSRFGLARWDGAGVTLATRSGNTARVDHTWSAWTPPASPSPAAISAPANRYLQARLELSAGASARLAHLRLFYLNQNQTPAVETVTVGQGRALVPADDFKLADPRASDLKKMTEALGALTGKPAGKDGAPPDPLASAGDKAGSRASPPPPLRSSPMKEVRWHAEDLDGDTLVYRLYFQGDGDPDWVPLTPRDPLEESMWAWNTESVPDGRYVLKVVASDERVNPAGEARTGARTSLAFVVDNTRPAVSVREIAPGKLEILVKDELSAVARAEVSVDGQEWKPVHPRDRIADGLEESFDCTLPALEPGTHAVAVRAADAEGNVGAARLFVRVRKP